MGSFYDASDMWNQGSGMMVGPGLGPQTGYPIPSDGNNMAGVGSGFQTGYPNPSDGNNMAGVG